MIFAGRVAHESIFNKNNGDYRCPNSQQGFAPFTTWTRGLAWIMCGYPEELEWLATLDDAELEPYGGRADVEEMMLKAARATCDFYIRAHADRRHPVLGQPARRNSGGWATISTDPRKYITTGNRWTAVPPRLPRRVCCG